MWFHAHRLAFAYLLMFLFPCCCAFAMDDPEGEQSVAPSNSEVVSDSELLAQFHNPTSKTADENWEQYMQRLLKAKFISESTFDKWKSGEAVTVEHAYTLEESRFETRFTKTPSPDGKRTVKSDPKSFEVPYTIRTTDYLEIPAPGDADQDAVLEGFFSEQRREPETAEAGQAHWSAKRSDENWKEYVQRLRKRGSITEKDHKRWLEGNAVNLVRSIPQRRYVPRKYGDLLGVVGVRKNATEDVGTPVPLEKMGNRFIVLMPVVETDQFRLRLPPQGKSASDAINQGFQSLETGRPLTESRPAGFRKRPPLSGKEKSAVLTKFTSKRKGESWDAYAQRMLAHGVISEAEFNSWKSGGKVINRMRLKFDGFREERRTRRVNVRRKVNGENVNETADQTYVVKVPVQIVKEGAFKLPMRGSEPEDASNPGYLFRTIKE